MDIFILRVDAFVRKLLFIEVFMGKVVSFHKKIMDGHLENWKTFSFLENMRMIRLTLLLDFGGLFVVV